MKAIRTPDGKFPKDTGEFCYFRMKQGDKWVWYIYYPNHGPASIDKHDVIEHDDGTITVSPSILVTYTSKEYGKRIIHGYLRKGIWTDV